jgi:very-short-patch-repair endonuclease
MKYQRQVRKEVRRFASRMRSKPTPSESALWECLRLKRLGGFRFRQQAIVFGFIADFYCPRCKLVVEVDGECHLDEQVRARDEMRTAKFATAGILVLRFTNEQVSLDLDIVLREIEAVCLDRC